MKEQFNPNLRKNKGNIFKNIFGICFIWFMIFIFTFYMDGETGMILAYFALFSAVFSYADAYLARKRINISFECDEYVKKGDRLRVRVNAEKSGKLPLAFIDLFIGTSETLGGQDMHYKLSLAFKNTEEFEIPLDGLIGGNGRIYIKEIFSSGFLGFVSYRAEVPMQSKNIGIIPDIPEINSSNALFRTINDIVITSDDEEEDSPLAFSANSTAGYEHRDYIQGDPLKRINWKLSSKRNKLMVRLDEASASVQPVVIIDLCHKNILSEEKNIQGAFGLLSLFVKQGIACKVYFKSESNNLQCINADSEESLNYILMTILITPSENITAFDESIFCSENACAYIMFSAEIPEKLIKSEFVNANKDCIHFIVADENAVNNSHANVWHLDSENCFRKV